MLEKGGAAVLYIKRRLFRSICGGKKRWGKEGLEKWHQFLACCPQSQTSIAPTSQQLECPLEIATGEGEKFLKGGWDSWGSTLHIHSGNGMRVGGVNEIILSDQVGGRGGKDWQSRVFRKIPLCNWQGLPCNICCVVWEVSFPKWDIYHLKNCDTYTTKWLLAR